MKTSDQLLKNQIIRLIWIINELVIIMHAQNMYSIP